MKTHNEAVAVTGMTGVGKDYLVEKANADHGFPVVNWGTLLGEELSSNRDTMMDTTDPRSIRAGQFIVCSKILEIQPVVVTCHTVRPNGSGFSYDLELEEKFNPSSYIFVTASPEVIHERVRRRNETGERQSQEIPIEEIRGVQAAKLEAVTRLSGILGCNMMVIHNEDETVEQNVQSISSVLSGLQATANLRQ